MTVALTVSRTLLSLSTLDVSVTPYRIGGPDQLIDAGTVTHRNDWVRSPYLEGATLAGTVRDLVDGCTLDVDVVGADQAAIKTNVTALIAAFTQFVYVLTLSLDGSTWAWTCGPADYKVGPAEESNVYGLLCPVRFLFSRQPVASSGPY